MQIALVHLVFNITGILIFYPVPLLRLPVAMARRLGEVTARYRWFSLAYLLFMFFIFPAIIFGLSIAGNQLTRNYQYINLTTLVAAGPTALYTALVPAALLLLLATLLALLQRKVPGLLPEVLRSWDFLPPPLRSLQPVDNLIGKLNCFQHCCKPKMSLNNNQSDNQGYQEDIV